MTKNKDDIKHKMRDFFVKIKYRMDMVTPFIGALNFILIVIIANSLRFAKLFKIHTLILVPIAVFMTYFFVWYVGYLFDAKLHIPRETTRMTEQRSPYHLDNWKRMNNQLDEIIAKLKEKNENISKKV